MNLKSKLCEDLITKGIVKGGEIINHSYTNGLNGKNPNSRTKLEDYIECDNGIMPCLTTRPDCLGYVERIENMENNGEPICLNSKGGRNGVDGLQPSLQDRVYSSSSSVAITTGFHPSYTDKEELRIRKLTPRECGKLMGVKDEDIDKMAKNQSDSSLYHLFGDSIVVNVLMAIFGELIK